MRPSSVHPAELQSAARPPLAQRFDGDEERQRLAHICASQREQLAHDWAMVHEALSPARNIKRMAKPVSAGLLAMGGGLLVIWLLRHRTVAVRRRLGYYLGKLAWLPRLWLSGRGLAGRAANIYGLIRASSREPLNKSKIFFARG